MESRQWILHVDLDQFQAAVEILRRPDLAGRPVVVGGTGDPTARRMVVTCASYPAREHGVRAGMPLRAAARACPDAIFLPLDPDSYDDASGRVMAVLRGFPVRVEVWGWDEAFVGAETDSPLDLAAEIQRKVREDTGLACSIGIGDTKQKAKIATGYAKPAGIYLLTDETWLPLMGPKPPDALWGVGPRTARSLAELGIHTVAALAGTDDTTLAARFGPNNGPYLAEMARGGGDAEIVTEERVPRSRSHQVTFPYDLTETDQIVAELTTIAGKVSAEVIDAGRTIIRVAVTVRTSTFWTRTHAITLPAPSRDPEEVARAAVEVLGRFTITRPVRLLSVRVDLADVS